MYIVNKQNVILQYIFISIHFRHDKSVIVPWFEDYSPSGCFTRDSLYGNPDGKPEKVLSFGGKIFFNLVVVYT